MPISDPVGPRAPNQLDPLAALLPRALVERYRAARRDVATIAARLAGERPAPFRTRHPRPVAIATASPIVARRLRVDAVVRETPDAVTLSLTDPMGARLAFTPGEFLTVLLTVDGEPLRRAYSLSSNALDASRVSITVKRVPGGRASNYVNDHVRAGEVLEVLGPSGAFTVRPDPAAAARHFVLIAGGSGITPMMSILSTVLAAEPGSRASLLYGNRRVDDVIFAAALERLAAEHRARFEVRHVLSDPPVGWTGGVGVLERATVCRELAAFVTPPAPDAEYFVCGPEAMMTEARAALLGPLSVPAERVREERFTNPAARVRPTGAPARAHTVNFRVRGATRDVVVPPDGTVLEAGLGAGLPLEYSCAMGGCGACRVKLVAGDVEMEEPNCLTDDERAKGYVLACISRPSCASTVEVG